MFVPCLPSHPPPAKYPAVAGGHTKAEGQASNLHFTWTTERHRVSNSGRRPRLSRHDAVLRPRVASSFRHLTYLAGGPRSSFGSDASFQLDDPRVARLSGCHGYAPGCDPVDPVGPKASIVLYRPKCHAAVGNRTRCDPARKAGDAPFVISSDNLSCITNADRNAAARLSANAMSRNWKSSCNLSVSVVITRSVSGDLDSESFKHRMSVD